MPEFDEERFQIIKGVLTDYPELRERIKTWLREQEDHKQKNK